MTRGDESERGRRRDRAINEKDREVEGEHGQLLYSEEPPTAKHGSRRPARLEDIETDEAAR